MSAPTLFLEHINERIEIGDFLNRKEKKQFREYMQEIRIPVISKPAP